MPRRAILPLAALVLCGCSGSSHPSPRVVGEKAEAHRFHYVPAGRILQRRCLAAARAVGYPIPCPTEVPSVMSYFGRLAYAEPPYAQRGWAFGSTTLGLGTAASPIEHLVWRASPRPVKSYAKLVNGPGSAAGVHVDPLAWVTIKAQRMRAVYVPMSSAAFGSHVVLIWTVGRHTYGLGFHDAEQFTCFCRTPRGLRQTLRLDEGFARHVKLVGQPLRKK